MNSAPIIIESGNWLFALVTGAGASYSLIRAYHNGLTKINTDILKALGVGLFGLSIYFAWFALSRHTSLDGISHSQWDLDNRHFAVPIASMIFAAGMLEVIHLIEDNAKSTRVSMFFLFVAVALIIGFW